MAKEPTTIHSKQTTDGREPTKRDLERQIGKTRESLSNTVEEIKETAEQGYAQVKESVLDYREQFQKEPLVWSLGALSAGFALGYTLGYAHKSAKKGRPTKLTQFTDRIVNELSTVGQSLVMPELNAKISQFFGVDFSDLLSDMRGGKQRTQKRTRTRALKSGAKKARPRRKSP